MRGLTEKDLAWADCAFISAMVVQRESARRIVGRCKEAGLRVVAGGPLFTSEHEQFEGVDHFVLERGRTDASAFSRGPGAGPPEARLYADTRVRGHAANARAPVGTAGPEATMPA